MTPIKLTILAALLAVAVGVFGVVSAHEHAPPCSVEIAVRSSTYDVDLRITTEARRFMVRIDGEAVSNVYTSEGLVFRAEHTEADAGTRHIFTAEAFTRQGETVCSSSGVFHVKG